MNSIRNKNFQLQVLTHSYHSYCIFENGEVFTWGDNVYGKLGLGDLHNRYEPQPFQLPDNEKILILSCGANHSACISRTEKLYIWGRGAQTLKHTLTEPKAFLFSWIMNKITFLTCGDSQILCVTEKKECYIWGNNDAGQLGLGDTLERNSPSLLVLPNNETVSYACIINHTACITEQGNCYIWGGNEYGQLGLGDTNSRISPNLLTLPNGDKIGFIACGGYYTICLSNQGNCYIWGFNKSGQLGLGSINEVLTPTLLTLPNNETISYISRGFHNVICLTTLGNCYAWGANFYGQLGLGASKVTVSVPTPFLLPNNEKISYLTSGYFHSFCLSTLGNWYGWGWNQFGQLGTGDKETRYQPSLLNLNLLSK